ncbi:hypothetical protein [Desmospora profundinema]|uniref:Uncharacterized protein n=1 Tax=Desmospora profundinema TaxID=1571184 RepID=A0ABU1IRK8_9BACL|nr:hypothetical protein [Desmospora profundinema]MDR6227058.1 hypothetical protein [Desmospora profundinema]
MNKTSFHQMNSTNVTPPNTHGIYFGGIGFIVMGLLTVLSPPSLMWGVIYVCTLILSGVWTAIGFIRKLDERPKWRGVYAIVHLDLLCFYGTAFLWRFTGEGLMRGIVFFGLLFAAALFGHIYRRKVLSEILGTRSWYTIVLFFIATGGGTGALGGIILGKINPHVGGYWMYFVFLLLTIVSHSMWAKAEDPNWKPD